MKNNDQILLESLYEKVLEEAKKKINPWAVAKSMHPKTKEKEEKIVKAVKKSAKKYGKEITSKSVKK
jgi:hypothetical protein